MRSHAFTLITFFGVVIILCLIPLFILGGSRTKKENVGLHSVIPPEMKKDLQIIHQASSSGAVLCTKEDPGICQKNQEGKVLEYNVGCDGANSASSVYICKKGSWTFVNWTPNGYCHFCGK